MGNNDYIYGKNSCRATLLNNSEVKSAIVSTSFNDKEILSLISKRKIALKRVSPNQLDSMFKGASTQGIALQIAPYKYMELDTLLKQKDNIKVLDICYGIGYNSKALMSFIINKNKKNILKKNLIKKLVENFLLNLNRFYIIPYYRHMEID